MANTLDSSLVPDTASERAITVLTPMLAALSVFSNDFSDELIDPTRPVSIPIVTDADDAQTGVITDYTANSDTTVGAEKISPVEVSKAFHITQAEVNSGHRMQNLFDINLRKVANAIIDLAMAPITVANYGAASVVAATPQDFDAADMRTLWGALKDSSTKNLVLEGAYYAEQLPANNDGFVLMDGAYGFDKFRYNNRFTGAGAGVKGFACSPNALGVASRLPALTPEVEAGMIHMENIEIPDLGLILRFCTWADINSRKTYGSYDVCFGAQKNDTSALKIIATA